MVVIEAPPGGRRWWSYDHGSPHAHFAILVLTSDVACVFSEHSASVFSAGVHFLNVKFCLNALVSVVQKVEDGLIKT